MIIVFTLAAIPVSAKPGVIEIDEDSRLELGFRLQTLAIFSEKDTDGDGTFESYDDFKVRRARFRLKAVVNEWMEGFLQTEVGSSVDDSGRDMRMIDAYLTIKLDPMFQILTGMHLAPAQRQNITSSGALMCIDRPGIHNKTLTWGTRSVYALGNATLGDSDAGLRGDERVRDNGITLFGAADMSDAVHFKYYLGAYDGIDLTSSDNMRYTARLQLNFMDPENGYIHKSTYLGKKQTVGIGLSYDTQDEVADSADVGVVDYNLLSADVFAELPMGETTLTAEASYITLDLDDATELYYDGTTATKNATRSQGDGFYVQAGLLVDKWQPWLSYETWDGDDASGKGSFDQYRLGLTYYLKGQAANIKGGYEVLEADAPIGSSTEDSVNSFVIGFYTTY
jgi:hypothetical protein